ncbi:MAG: glycosyltransferase family 39 protein, partial [bacterium]|nr:glycosyltransferase family 39 protein [bacterium]
MTQQPANSAPSPLQRWWPVALVAAVALVTYATSLRNEFIYDDWNLLVHNSAIRSWGNWWELVDPTSTFNRTFELLSWRPTLNLSYLVGYQLFGLNAGGHHLLTVVLHALNAALVYHFLRKLTSNATVALVGGLAFAVHPVHAEAIQVSSLRMDVLATPFFLAALLAHMRLRERPDDRPFVWAGLAAGSCFFSLMGKEIGAAVPLVALLLDLRKEELKALTSRAGMLPYLGYASVGVIYGWLRFGLFSNIHQGAGYLGGSPLAALLSTGKIFAAYAGHLLMPLTLRADYVVTFATGLDVATVAAW